MRRQRFKASFQALRARVSLTTNRQHESPASWHLHGRLSSFQSQIKPSSSSSSSSSSALAPLLLRMTLGRMIYRMICCLITFPFGVDGRITLACLVGGPSCPDIILDQHPIAVVSPPNNRVALVHPPVLHSLQRQESSASDFESERHWPRTARPAPRRTSVKALTSSPKGHGGGSDTESKGRARACERG